MKLRLTIRVVGTFAFLLGPISMANQVYHSYFYVFNRQKVKVPIGEIDGTLFNDVCIQNESHCEALRQLRHPQTARELTKLNAETAASDYCQLAGGAPLILTSEKQDQSLFCTFKDLSMVDARAILESADKQSGRRK